MAKQIICNMAAKLQKASGLSSSNGALDMASIAESSFTELCRSCGKTNSELYDLFYQQQNAASHKQQHESSDIIRATAANSVELNRPASTTTTETSPLTTSSTTCYNHLTTAQTEPQQTLSAQKTNNAAAAVTAQSTSSKAGFDSIAATAKATAKGQSNMENILQEMQIWEMQVGFFHYFLFD